MALTFNQWLAENYGYENGRVYGEEPPNCVGADGGVRC